jgi:hypothetical protein
MKPPKRRWLQFSVRSLVLSLTIFALWLGWQVHRARRQREAVETIEAAGGIVTYQDEQSSADDQIPAKAAPRERGWLARVLGDAYVDTVVAAQLVNGTNEELVAASRLPRLERLALFNSHLTDEDLSLLRGLTKLRSLTVAAISDAGWEHLGAIGQTRVTGVGLAHLPRPTKLLTLNLRGAPVTDEGMAFVGRLTALKDLDLGDTRITDRGMAHLRGLTQLDVLCLDGNDITDQGLIHLKRLANLEGLWLKRTRITDDGLVNLVGLKKLYVLRLNDTAITDRGLRHFDSMPSLVGLDLRGTRVTQAGIAELKGRLPRLRVTPP